MSPQNSIVELVLLEIKPCGLGSRIRDVGSPKTTNNLSKSQSKKIKIKQRPHIFFLRLEVDFFWL